MRVLSLVILAVLPAFGAIRSVTPDMYGGQADSWAIKRNSEKHAIATNVGAKVVFIGDSITHGWESKGYAQWKRYFETEPGRALNLGVSFDRTEHVLWRIGAGGALDGYEAKCVVLMIGTNNTGHRSFDEEPPADTILGVREVLRTIRAKQPRAKVVLMGILPIGNDASDPRRARNRVVNAEICRFADGRDVFWCDIGDQLLTPSGKLLPTLVPDRCHPGPLGYEIWAAAVKPYVDYALSDGKLTVPPNRFASRFDASDEGADEPRAAYPQISPLWNGLDRLLEHRNQIAASGGAIDLVFLGDSITHGWEQSGKESLAELRKTYSVLNLGFSGDCTENLVWRGLYGELTGYKAKCVMLTIGTNNIWTNHDRPEDVACGVKRILEVIAEKQPQAKVLLLPIFPRSSAGHPNYVKNEAVNKIIRDYADGEKVIWVDFNAKFLDEKGDSTKYMPDHCHPNAAGYREIWLPAVLPHFRAICGK